MVITDKFIESLKHQIKTVYSKEELAAIICRLIESLGDKEVELIAELSEEYFHKVGEIKMYYWYTLAYSDIGTHKMKFKEKMSIKEAVKLGESYCKENNLIYVGTYDKEEVEFKENKLRLNLYF